jgi:uncharacterized protein YdeI (YjbR/CyaY-like superfamily)
MNNSNKPDLPLGLGMALANNSAAMTKFANLSDDRKREIIEQTHSLNSKQEMKEFVNGL